MGIVTSSPAAEGVSISVPWYRRAHVRTALTLFLMLLPVVVLVHAYVYLTFYVGNLKGLISRSEQVFEVSLYEMEQRLLAQERVLAGVIREPQFIADLTLLPEHRANPVLFERTRARLLTPLITDVSSRHYEILWVQQFVIFDDKGEVWVGSRSEWEGRRLSPLLLELLNSEKASSADEHGGQGGHFFLLGGEESLGLEHFWIGLVQEVTDNEGRVWRVLGIIPLESLQTWLTSFRVLGGVPFVITLDERAYFLSEDGQIIPWTSEQVRRDLLDVPEVPSLTWLTLNVWRDRPGRLSMRPAEGYHPEEAIGERHRHFVVFRHEGGDRLWVLVPMPLFHDKAALGIEYDLGGRIGPLATQVRRGLVFQTFFILAVVGAASWWLGRRFTQPLREIMQGVQALAAGQWDARVPARGEDEFALLGQVFNQMAARLESLYRTMEDEIRRRTYQVNLLMQWLTLDAPHDTWTFQAFLESMVWGLREALPSGVYPVLLLWNDDLQEVGWRVAPDFPEGKEPPLAVERRWVQQALRQRTAMLFTVETHPDQVSAPFQAVWVSPLLSREQPFGALVLYSTQAGVFTEEFQHQMQELEPTLVSALAFAQTSWLRFQLHALVQVMAHMVQSVGGEGDLMEVFFAVARILERYFPRSIFLVRQGDADVWQPLYPAALAGRRVESLVPVSREQRWLLEADLESLRAVQRLPKELRDLAQELEWRGMILMPVWVEDRVAALLLLGMEWPEEYPVEILNALSLITLLLGMLLDRAGVQERLRLWEMVMTFFVKGAEAPTLGQALSVLERLLRAHLSPEGDFFFVLGDEEGRIRDAYIFLEGQEQYHLVLSPVDRALASMVLRVREPRVFNEPSEIRQALGDQVNLAQASLPQSWIGLPIVVGDRVLGVWGLRDMHQAYRFDVEFLHRMTTLTQQLAPALEYLVRMQQYEHRLQREEWIHALGVHLVSLWDPASLTREAASELQRIFRAQRISFRLHVPTLQASTQERFHESEIEQAPEDGGALS